MSLQTDQQSASPVPGRDQSLLDLLKDMRSRMTGDRLALQKRGPKNRRRHVSRAAVRLATLLVSDFVAFALTWAGLNLIRNPSVVGSRVAELWTDLLPIGLLGDWEFGVAILVGLTVTGSYGAGDARRDPKRLFIAGSLATGLSLWTYLWASDSSGALLAFVITAMIVWSVLVAERLFIDRITSRIGYGERQKARAVFIGSWEEYNTAVKGPAFTSAVNYEVVGFVETNGKWSNSSLGSLEHLHAVLNDVHAETVVICGYLDDERFQEVVETTHEAGCELLAVPRLLKAVGVEPQLVWRRGQPLIELTAPHLKAWQLFVKRAMDLIGAVSILLLLAPFMLAVAIVIKLDSSGPVIFAQARLGSAGRRFRCLKFRSMRDDAEEILRQDPALYEEYVDNHFKLPEDRDPRLTQVGTVLRRTSFDELPQLFNVLLGSMSLVGPRPIVPKEIEHYGLGAPAFLSLKPGMTGAWAVNGRSDVGYPKRTLLELSYIRTWSIVGDLLILLRTVPAVLRHRGAH